jgi:predicted RNase H-like nuclease (RuvC/YqgF family)
MTPAEAAKANVIDKLRQQLADSQKRVAELEDLDVVRCTALRNLNDDATRAEAKLAALTTPRDGDAVMDALDSLQCFVMNPPHCGRRTVEYEFEKFRAAVIAERASNAAENTALRAQVPTVVIPENISIYESGHGWWVRAWVCPSCKTRKAKGTEHKGVIPDGDKFCSCGAKLDWSQEAAS